MTRRLLIGLMCLCSAPLVIASEPVFTVVYTPSEGKYPVIRTPQLLATSKGTLLAFAQGRFGDHDQAGSSIIVKRSNRARHTPSAFPI